MKKSFSVQMDLCNIAKKNSDLKTTKINLFLVISFSLIACNYQMINQSGLKGRVKEVTSYKMLIDRLENDSILKDTILVSTSKFNKKGKIDYYSNIYYYFDSIYTYKGKNIYDSNNKIVKEIGYHDNGKIVVNYHYKDTLLQKIYSKSERDDEILEMYEKYYYSDKGKVIKRVTSDIFIENNDTVSSSNLICKYDSNERLYESKMVENDILDSMKTTISKFEYNDLGLTSKVTILDDNDSLINIIVYKYEFDTKGSWIKKETYEDNILKYLITRIIKYD